MDDKLIKENILKVLLYYHIFKHPLTLDEIYTFYPDADITRQNLEDTLQSLVSDNGNIIGEQGGFYFISPYSDYVSDRLSKETISLKIWKIAQLITVFIKVLPFVRGVFITGSLAKNSSDKDSDIDFLIVSKENRLWICRTLLMLFRRIFLLNNSKYFCLNYFLTENNLNIDDRNIFTATELAHIKVTYNASMLEQLMQSNKWIDRYFPNYLATDSKYHFANSQTSDTANILQPFFEIFFRGRIGDSINLYLQEWVKRRVKRRYPAYPVLAQNQSYQLTTTRAKTHGVVIDNKKDVLDKYKYLLKQYNISGYTEP
jgi:predicted nucleotidyltransferase